MSNQNRSFQKEKETEKQFFPQAKNNKREKRQYYWKSYAELRLQFSTIARQRNRDSELCIKRQFSNKMKRQIKNSRIDIEESDKATQTIKRER